jgi:hypothetical protein
MVGVATKDLPRVPAPAAGSLAKANQTIVGMPAKLVRSDIDPLPFASSPQRPVPGGEISDKTQALYGRSLPRDGALPPAAAPAIPSKVNRTIVGMSATQPLGTRAIPTDDASPAPAPPQGASSTLLGVARPGIAPLAPGVARDLDEPDLPGLDERPQSHNDINELGATIGPSARVAWPKMPDQGRRDRSAREDLRRRRHAAPMDGGLPRQKRRPISKRALAVVFAAFGLALAAALVALFWPSAPPLTARARADAEGHEGVELHCKSCPDGTQVRIGEASATMSDGRALIALPAALSLGENRMKVAIDRPGNGRHETVGVTLNVAYRIRPDLSTLQADKPAIQIIAEAAAGTSITLDGKPMQLSGGRAVESVDVTEACSGLTGEPRALTRQIPYTVTTESGPPERGVINVSVGIVPLQLEAPGPRVTIDGTSFVLAGRTMKGAEVLAAGRPITVRADGTFAQVMNVSSIGATQIEVRAKLQGLAPRLSQIKVRRVDTLETAARDFAAEQPISYAPLAQNLTGQIGKPIFITGEVIEARKQGYTTVMLLDVPRTSGCPTAGTCTVRLVQGAENPAKKGDLLRVYGHVSRPFSVPGRADIPEVEVDFTLKAQK